MAQSQSWRSNTTPFELMTERPTMDQIDSINAWTDWFSEVYRFASIEREETLKEASWMALKQVLRTEKRKEYYDVLYSLLHALHTIYNTEDPDHPYTPLDPDDSYPTPTPPTPPNN
jgi:hypothetical protein